MAAPEVDPSWIRGPADELAIAEGCYFDERAGSLVCDFVETFCRQSKGRNGGERLVLLPWQRDFVMRLFGWKTAEGFRRYRRAYLEVAKKNGKSTLLSAIVLYLLIADGEPGPEVYLNAVDREQARIVFDEAARMVRSSPDLDSRLAIVDSRHRITYPKGNGLIRCNSADAPSKDGLNPHGVVFDELHRQRDTQLWDIFEHADASREQPLWINITTAGEDETGVWFEQREYSEKVNRGEIEDLTHLGVVYRADPDDDIDDPATWAKANPSLGHTLTEQGLRIKLKQARQTPRKLADFKRLRLNIVTRAATALIDPDGWKACASPTPADPAALAGRPLYAGGDLSRTVDLTALALLWGDDDSGYDLAVRFYLPEGNLDALAERDRVPYRHWASEGWVTPTPGEVVDYGFIRRDLVALARGQDLRKALFDPYNATKLLIELREEDGLPVGEIRQGFLSLSAPTKQLERLVKARKIRHDGNPCLSWMVGNAVADVDAAGNIKLSKKKSRLKIDGVAATVNAVAAAPSDPEGGDSVYESRGILLL